MVQQIKAYFKSLKDYRHWIMIVVIGASIALIPFFFRYAHLRIWESCVAFGNSFKYYISELLGLELHGENTVNDFTQLPFDLPFNLPRTWDEFKENLSGYWSTFFSMENFSAYMGKVADVLFYITKIILIVMPVFLVGFIISIFVKRNSNNNHGEASKALRRFIRFEIKVYTPIKNWFKDFFGFVREHKGYLMFLFWIWAYSFNVIAIGISFFAYYLYFISALKTPTLYIQVVKLLMDLSVMLNFIPKWLWVIIAIVALEFLSRKIAYDRLAHRERRNRGFINERGVVTFVTGVMGAGKTMQITDMALSTEVQFRDMALEIMLEIDRHFPFFPYINFENALKRAIKQHSVYDLPSCRKFVRFLDKCFCIGLSDTAIRKSCRRQLKKRYGINYDNLCFGYNYEYYGLTYDDKLQITDLWTALEDYACAYFIYTIQSSLLLSNYSIRTDMQFSDLGNFPIWDGDFFKRDSRLIDSNSRFSHILDQDMLRLGTQMLKDNPNRNAFGFGVYIISEIDKERKNTPELSEIKRNSTECNQKNDLFNTMLKMCRHACVVANRVFIKIFADLQRPDSLGADARELGEIVEIKSKGDKTVTLPFFAPYYFIKLLDNLFVYRYNGYHIKYRYLFGDYTLPFYCLKSISSFLGNYCERTEKLFGSRTLTLEVESGAREGEVKQCKYYDQDKKDKSKRYSSDCLSGIFYARSQANFMSLDEMKEFAGIMATDYELGLQNSHFYTEIKKLNNSYNSI